MADHQAATDEAAVPAGRGLTWYLAGLVLAAVVPIVAAAAFALMQASRAFEEAQSDRLVETARTLARAAESELDGGITLVNILTMMPVHPGASLVVDPWARIAQGQIGGRLVEEVFVSDQVPAGTGLSPRGVPLSVLREAAETGRPAVSNLFLDPSAAELRIAAAAVVSRADQEIRFIAVIVPPERLVQALKRSRPASDDLLLAVVDGTGHMIARNIEPERHIGQKVPGWDARLAVRGTSGTFMTLAADGRETIFSFKTIRNTPGWVMVVGEPLSAFQARATGPIVGLGVAAVLALVLALLAALRLARAILRPVSAMAARARLIADSGERPVDSASERSDIAEFEALRVSLERSETALRDRAAAEAEAARSLAESERRYRLLATTGALVFWRISSDAKISLTGWNGLTGEDSPLGDNWYSNIHPDDVAVARATWNEARLHGDHYHAEYRIRVKDGTWRWVRSRGSKVLTEDGTDHEWVGLVEDIDALRAAQARMAHMVHHDALTGIGNRALFQDRLKDLCAGSHGETAVLCIGLDRFKAINDTLGHGVGDTVLVTIASRLQGLVGADDLLVRIGGDEFAIIQTAGTQPLAASLLASRVMEAVAAPIAAESHSLTLTASVGIALLDEAGADEALKNADLALDRAKEDGRARFCFFEPAMDARMKERHRLERDLRTALAEGQFLLNHQPIVAVTSGALVGFEALVRWRHPERGMVSPAEFIPMAEETGLITQLGRWVLERACEDAARWSHGLKVAVNVSPKQLADRDFPLAVEQALRLSGLAPGLLELEITENALMADIEGAMSMMLRLKALGCSIAMDDFGTGYSSLGYLRTFPFDKVKIDRSFVQDLGQAPESGAIVRAVTGLCGSLDITSTAEGVETEEQLALLRAEGCDQAQGYLFGRPVPVEDVPAVLARFGISRQVPYLVETTGTAAA